MRKRDRAPFIHISTERERGALCCIKIYQFKLRADFSALTLFALQLSSVFYFQEKTLFAAQSDFVLIHPSTALTYRIYLYCKNKS